MMASSEASSSRRDSSENSSGNSDEQVDEYLSSICESIQAAMAYYFEQKLDLAFPILSEVANALNQPPVVINETKSKKRRYVVIDFYLLLISCYIESGAMQRAFTLLNLIQSFSAVFEKARYHIWLGNFQYAKLLLEEALLLNRLKVVTTLLKKFDLKYENENRENAD